MKNKKFNFNSLSLKEIPYDKRLTKRKYLEIQFTIKIKLEKNKIPFYIASSLLDIPKNIFVLVPYAQELSKKKIQDIFNSKECQYYPPYAVFDILNFPIHMTFYQNDEEFQFKKTFYDRDLIGILLSRFFVDTEYTLTDTGLLQHKKQILFNLSIQELLSILEINENNFLQANDYKKILSVIESSPYYKKAYIEKFYTYKISPQEKKFIFILRKIRSISLKKYKKTSSKIPITHTQIHINQNNISLNEKIKHFISQKKFLIN